MKKSVEEYVRSIPDFPEPGIIFRDITSVLQDADGLHMAIDTMQDLVKDVDFDVVVGAESRGFIFGTPVYYAHPSGRILSFLDRVFYSSGRVFAFKPAASVAVARRGGCSASFDVLNKYYGICQMPVAGSTYWNMVHGCEPGEVKLDTEGMQTMRNLAKNLAWMMKCFEAGKVAGVPLPETERGNQTNFIR